MNTGGIHQIYGVNPDMASFAKAIANGYPMAAVIGKRSIMEAAQTSFISSTIWTEKIGPAAALATIHKHRKKNVSEHLIKTGIAVQTGWNDAAARQGLKLKVSGIPPLSHFEFDYAEHPNLSTLFTQEMLGREFLASTVFYANYSHQANHINTYLQAVEEVFGILVQAIQNEEVELLLHGPARHSGFQRLN